MQSAIECALYIAKKQTISIEEIEHIDIGVHPAMVGKLTANQPVDHQQAQLSTPFAVAMAFYYSQLKGNEICLSIDDFANAFSNSDIMNLSAKITCHEDKEVEEKTSLESVAARVLCKMKNGSEFEHFIEHPLGCPANPMRLDHISKRFIQLSEHQVGHQECLDWLALTVDVASLKSIDPLMTLRLKP